MSKLNAPALPKVTAYVLRELIPHKRNLIFVAICGLLMAGAQAQIAVQIKGLMDGLQDRSQLLILQSGGIILGLALVMSISRFFHYYLMNITGEQVTQQLRAQLQKKFMRLSLTFHNNYATGSGGLISRILNDVLIVQNGLRLFADLFREPFSFLFLLVWLFILNWKLTMSIIVLLPIISLFLRQLSRSVAKYSRRGYEGLEKISSVIKESLDGMRIIQSFNLESEMARRFDSEFGQYFENRKKIHRRMESNGPITEFVATVMILAILTYMSLEIAAGRASYGDFASYLGTLLMLNKPIKTLQDAYVRVQETLVAASRISSVLAEEAEVPEIQNPVAFPANWKAIRYKNVSFSYGQGLVLKNVDFEIQRGEVVAFVGASGSGKSTIVNLLERFFDPTEGQILIDDVPIQNIKLSELRKNVALVTQDVYLFSDSVERNIWSGDFSQPKDKVVACAKAAHAHDFIAELPDGYQTKMGERGNLFSGGEKQRISIARALFKDAPILILDEATSALDSQSEAEVQAGLDTLIEGRTSLVIAHRLSTIAKADRIFVMQKGQIVEMGTHLELVAKKGEYFQLSQLQNLE
jgi:ATP-binding cassette subfamily B protein/subfamily B ATP-binding cassette protein MsbA